MRILGPDGKPFDSGPPIAKEVREILDRAQAIAAQGDPATALQQMGLAFQYDVVSTTVLNTTCDLLAAMAQVSGDAQSEELQLFQALRDNTDDPALYYQVGNRFFQLQQPFLARPFLARARELVGSEINQLTQAIDVDYSQVLMDIGAYEDAINAFHALNDTYGGLPIWLVLEMAECYALLRQIDEAEAVYQIAPPQATESMPGMEEMRDEVGDLLARVRDFDGVEEIGLRAWHYVQTRGILMETNPAEETPGERFIFFAPSEEDVAYIIGISAAALDAKGYAPNRILWLGESSETLARLFAQWWEVEEEQVRAYQPGDNADDEADLALLVMSHSYDILSLGSEEAVLEVLQARAGLITFALDVRWTERQLMTPDIAGFMSQMCFLPWETRLEVAEDQQSVRTIRDTRTPVEAAEQIAQMFPDDEELDQFAQELLEEYAGCTDLILDHRDGALIRLPLATHSPIKSPRVGY